MGDDRVTLGAARLLAHELRLTDTTAPVVVLDSHTFLLLDTYAPREVTERLHFGGYPSYAGTSSRIVDWRAYLQDGKEQDPVHLVGPSFLDELPSMSSEL